MAPKVYNPYAVPEYDPNRATPIGVTPVAATPATAEPSSGASIADQTASPKGKAAPAVSTPTVSSDVGNPNKRYASFDGMPDFKPVAPVKRPSNFVSFAEFAGANDEGFRQQAAGELDKQTQALGTAKGALAKASTGYDDLLTDYASTGSYSDFQKALSGASETIAGTANTMAVSTNPMEEALRQIYRQRIAAGATDAGKALSAIGEDGAAMATEKDRQTRVSATAASLKESRKQGGIKAEAEAKAKREADAAESDALRSEWLQSDEFFQWLNSIEDGRMPTDAEVAEWLAPRMATGRPSTPQVAGDMTAQG